MKKGFTLLELMAVVIIVSILAAVALPQYKKAVNRARLAEAVSNMGVIQKGIDMYCMQFKADCNAGVCFSCQDGQRLDGDLALEYGGAGSRQSKDFLYYYGCNSGNACTVNITPKSNNELPTLRADRTKSGLTVTWTKTCTGADTYCDGLISQGFSTGS